MSSSAWNTKSPESNPLKSYSLRGCQTPGSGLVRFPASDPQKRENVTDTESIHAASEARQRRLARHCDAALRDPEPAGLGSNHGCLPAEVEKLAHCRPIHWQRNGTGNRCPTPKRKHPV